MNILMTENELSYITLPSDNLGEEHICCAFSDEMFEILLIEKMSI